MTTKNNAAVQMIHRVSQGVIGFPSSQAWLVSEIQAPAGQDCSLHLFGYHLCLAKPQRDVIWLFSCLAPVLSHLAPHVGLNCTMAIQLTRNGIHFCFRAARPEGHPSTHTTRLGPCCTVLMLCQGLKNNHGFILMSSFGFLKNNHGFILNSIHCQYEH